MLVYIDDREDESSEDNYGYDYGDEENSEYDMDEKPCDATENNDSCFD
ncbi:MAG: hypothetical protein Q9M32_08330 [Sulfurimonas sp.]|nr:hypothetical protein [Sulfurimonas sp.]MDQ7062093.1 hypothetical protein [Sulfurimonas sp.]